MMRLADKARRAFVVGFVAGIGAVGIQDVDADGSTDFTARGRRRPLVERPVEPDDADGDGSSFCVLDIETTGFSPECATSAGVGSSSGGTNGARLESFEREFYIAQ